MGIGSCRDSKSGSSMMTTATTDGLDLDEGMIWGRTMVCD